MIKEEEQIGRSDCWGKHRQEVPIYKWRQSALTRSATREKFKESTIYGGCKGSRFSVLILDVRKYFLDRPSKKFLADFFWQNGEELKR